MRMAVALVASQTLSPTFNFKALADAVVIGTRIIVPHAATRSSVMLLLDSIECMVPRQWLRVDSVIGGASLSRTLVASGLNTASPGAPIFQSEVCVIPWIFPASVSNTAVEFVALMMVPGMRLMPASCATKLLGGRVRISVVVPCATVSPRSSTTMDSARLAISSGLCEIRMVVRSPALVSR